MRVTTTLINTAGSTTDPIRVADNTHAGLRAEFVRLPKPSSTCPITGLSRSGMWNLIAHGHVKSVCLRQKGAAKGTRLVHLQSLLDYLHSQLDVIENN
jgi:hypothetical protein